MADYARPAVVVAAAIVLSNVTITIRFQVVEQIGHGTAQTAGVILAAMRNLLGSWQDLSLLSPLTQLFRDRLLVVSGGPISDPNVDRGFYQISGCSPL